MHQRFLSWLILSMFGAITSLYAQAPAAGGAAVAMPPGAVLVAKVSGTVRMTVNGATTPIQANDRIPQTAKVNTDPASSAVLVFSNGATTQLGEDTELVIEEFLQDPFAATIQVANLEEEPTPSRTRLSLNRGELVGNVKKLKYGEGSSFTVNTPVGAAGIRGTTFRIVFRPTGTGLAFFSLSTVEGNVAFAGQGTGGAGGAAGGPAGGAPDPNAPAGAGGTGGSGGVAVGGGQEVVITVSVNVNPTTGQVTITAPPTVTSTLVVPISAATQAAVVQQAQTMAVAVATTTFTANTGGGGGGPSGSTTGSTGGQGGASFTGGTPDGGAAVNTTPPPPTPPAPRVTTGDGI